MRFLVALLLLLPVVACAEEAEPMPGARATTPGSSASTTPAAMPTATPTAVTCPRGKPQVLTFDYGGDRSFTALLTVWSKELGRPVVDRSRRRIWFVREDGTAHTRLDWTRARRPLEGRAWFVEGLEQCGDHARWRSLKPSTIRVELEVGHCWIEPVKVAGDTWDVTREDQFGSGGRMPERFARAGRLAPAGDVAIYVDDSGRHLTLVPAGDRWVLERRGCA